MSIQRILGIDFGTSTSLIRVRAYENGEPVGKVESVEFEDGGTVPTLILHNKKYNETMVGYEAAHNSDQGGLLSNFKLDLASKDEETRKNALKNVGIFFKHLYETYDDQRTSIDPICDTETTYISYPVKWKKELRNEMKNIASSAGFQDVRGIDEASAAIHAVLVQQKDKIRQIDSDTVNILLIDMGAGTTDLALCKCTLGQREVEVLNTWPKDGHTLFGGREVDEALWGYVKKYLNDCGITNFPNEANNIASCKGWKEKNVAGDLLKYKTMNSCGIAHTYLSNVGTEKPFPPMDRAVFEDLLEDYLRQFPDMVNGILHNTPQCRHEDVDMVVFAGGHSRWYFADEMIFGKMTRFGEINIPKIKAEPWRVIKLARPHETVALGMVYQPISVEVKRASAQEQYEKGEKFYYEAENYEEAVKWYRKAAEQGHANAQFYLGVLYHTGRGVEQNYEEAIKWLRKATAQDFGPAQYLMGHLYRDGNGVEKNYEEAVKWYRKAAEQGSEYAQNQLGFHYSEGLGVEKDNYEAVKWFRKAAEQGHVDAQASMGYAYYFGEGVEENHNEAVNWYRKAAEQGCEDSRDILEQIYDAGYTGPQDDDGAGAASTQKTRNIKIERKKQFTGAANVHKVSINGEYVCDLRGGEIVNCAAMSDTAEIDFVDALKFNFTTRLNLRLHGDSAYVHVHMGGFMSDFDLKFDVRGAEVVSIQGVYADGSIREM